MSGDKTPAQVLREARELLSAPERWTKGAYARNKAGKETLLLSRAATRWCASGAILRVQKTTAYQRLTPAEIIFRKSLRRKMIDFNDALHTTHAKLLAAFDRAIAKAEAAP